MQELPSVNEGDQVTNEAWKKGYRTLKLAFSDREVPEEQRKARGDLYRRKLDDLTDEQWMKAVNRCLDTETFFPAIATLRNYGKPPEPTEAQAVAVFEQVVECREYRPNGSIWHLRKIRETLGPAAAEGFAAAGGQAAFAWLAERDLPFVRKNFVEAYTAAVRLDPKLALPEAKTPELTA